MSATDTALTYVFRVRPARTDNRAIVTAVLNALVSSTRVILLGTMDDAQYDALVAQFASDKGTTVLRYDRTPAQLRSAVAYTAKTLGRKPTFAAIDAHSDGEWSIVGYAVSEPR